MLVKWRFTVAVLAVVSLVLIISPFISLFLLPVKFSNHAYRQLSDRVIVERQTRGLNSQEEIILKLFEFVHNNLFLPKNSLPYYGKPLDFLIRGIGWCDYQAKVFNVLLSKKGISSRYAMLMDSSGVSRHTVSEVYFHNRWVIFDPTEYTFFKLLDGEYATLNDLSQNPQIIFEHQAFKNLEENEYQSRRAWYLTLFPMPILPMRSDNFMKDITIFDRALDLYYVFFGHTFANTYQNIYLKNKLASFKEHDYKLFYAARNYSLYGRRGLAMDTYSKLINDFPDSKYRDDSLFFLSLQYVDMDEDYGMAVLMLKRLLTEYGDSDWSNIASRMVEKYSMASNKS